MPRFSKPQGLLLFVAGLANVASAAQFGAIPTMPGATEMRAISVSADGQLIAGQMHAGSSTRAFRWNLADPVPELLSDLPNGANENESVAISSTGNVVVGRGESAAGSEAALWPAVGPPIGLGDLPDGFHSSRATSVSANGTIAVGTGYSMMGREAFRWSAGPGMHGLGFLPNGIASEAFDVSDNGSVVVGFSETFDAILGEAFRWTSGGEMVGLGDLAGGDFMSRATAVSANGNTVVGVSNSSLGDEAFRWTAGGTMQALGDLAGGIVSSTPYDVSADGNIVVGAGTTENANTTAFMWTSDLGMRSLADVLVEDYGLSSELDGWDLLAAHSVSPNGQTIVGTGINPSGQIRGWWAELDGVQMIGGDINGDGQLDVDDLDPIQVAVREGNQSSQFDLNGDGTVNADDTAFWVHEIKNTYFGDANLDGTFDSGDLVEVFKSAQYEDEILANSNWTTGDWNGDLEFSSSDIVFAFQDAGYEKGRRIATQAVPEPASRILTIIASTGLLLFFREVKAR
ncbi:hypothetical protein ACFL2H_05215 [Planctomycetota bacterium]